MCQNNPVLRSSGTKERTRHGCSVRKTPKPCLLKTAQSRKNSYEFSGFFPEQLLTARKPVFSLQHLKGVFLTVDQIQLDGFAKVFLLFFVPIPSHTASGQLHVFRIGPAMYRFQNSPAGPLYPSTGSVVFVSSFHFFPFLSASRLPFSPELYHFFTEM